MSELTTEVAKSLLGTHKVELPAGQYVFVRTLTGADLALLSNIGDEPMGKLFALLLCDENGTPRANGAIADYPAWVIKRVVEEGMKFNHLYDEIEERKKN